MFGMLDYRAHKLYIILFCIPTLILVLFLLFGIPIISYLIGLRLFDARIFQIISSLVSLFIIGSIWGLFVTFFISKLYGFTFSLFVDVIPHDGRTKEEAQMVVYGGDSAILFLEGDKHPSKWRENFGEEVAKTDWVKSLFFKNKNIERFRLMKQRFEFDDEEEIDAYKPYKGENFLKEANLEPSWFEIFICNKLERRDFVSYLFFVFLLVLNPAPL